MSSIRITSSVTVKDPVTGPLPDDVPSKGINHLTVFL